MTPKQEAQQALELYHAVWSAVNNLYYFRPRLGDWTRWQHKFDTQIKTISQARTYCAQMLRSIDDRFCQLTVGTIEQKIAGDNRRPPCSASMLTASIGYIRMETFDSDQLAASLEHCLRRTASARALILDLRGNTGGKLDQAIQSVSLFMDEGIVMAQQERRMDGGEYQCIISLTADGFAELETNVATGARQENRFDRRPNLSGNKPLVILVDRYSASASELLTGALKDNKRAFVLGGSNTAGKSIGQTTVRMPCGLLLTVTNMIVLPPSLQWLGDAGLTERIGLTPDRIICGSSRAELEDAVHLLQRVLGEAQSGFSRPHSGAATGVGGLFLLAAGALAAGMLLAGGKRAA